VCRRSSAASLKPAPVPIPPTRRYERTDPAPPPKRAKQQRRAQEALAGFSVHCAVSDDRAVKAPPTGGLTAGLDRPLPHPGPHPGISARRRPRSSRSVGADQPRKGAGPEGRRGVDRKRSFRDDLRFYRAWVLARDATCLPVVRILHTSSIHRGAARQVARRRAVDVADVARVSPELYDRGLGGLALTQGVIPCGRWKSRGPCASRALCPPAGDLGDPAERVPVVVRGAVDASRRYARYRSVRGMPRRRTARGGTAVRPVRGSYLRRPFPVVDW
jgi:hypothetical protein